MKFSISPHRSPHHMSVIMHTNSCMMNGADYVKLHQKRAHVNDMDRIGCNTLILECHTRARTNK